MNKKCIHEPRTQKQTLYTNTNPNIYRETTRNSRSGSFFIWLCDFVADRALAQTWSILVLAGLSIHMRPSVHAAYASILL